MEWRKMRTLKRRCREGSGKKSAMEEEKEQKGIENEGKGMEQEEIKGENLR